MKLKFYNRDRRTTLCMEKQCGKTKYQIWTLTKIWTNTYYSYSQPHT